MPDRDSRLDATTAAGPDQSPRAARRPLLWEAAPAIDIVRPEEAKELREILFGQALACDTLSELVPSLDGSFPSDKARTLRFALAALGALRSCGNKLGPEAGNAEGSQTIQVPDIPLFPDALDDTSGKKYRQLARDVWIEWPEESCGAWRGFRRRQLDIAARAVPLRDRMAPGVGLDIAERVWAFVGGTWQPASAALCYEAKGRELGTVVALSTEEAGLEITLQRALLVALRVDGRLYDLEWEITRRWASDLLRSHMPPNS